MKTSDVTCIQPGMKHASFIYKDVLEIPEIQCTLIEITHVPTGAEILHIAAEDDENLFNLSFRTWPSTSNGVAHILEHTVLCGSEKFPVRDPFFSMDKRSLNTFMNAFTGADFTCYPAASQVPKDFYNLLEVYLDAVFHPLLQKESFLQEGWRFEFLQPENPSSPLVYKGIVFNEMKGAMATADARLGEALMQGLFPSLTYGINSGGNPKNIPQLTYEELQTFHKKFYHPSRCLFFFYGNIPVQSHLDFLEQHLLKHTQKVSSLPKLPQQPRFSKQVSYEYAYPISEEEEEKALLGMGWLLCSILDQQELLALNVLDLLLMGTDASPLKMSLLKSGLCKQADSYLDNDLSEIPFILFCKGCKPENADAIEACIRDTLASLSHKTFSPDLIEGAIHQLEFSRKEIGGNSSPYGLSLYFRAALLKQHGGCPEDALRIHTLFEELRNQDPQYFSSLIKKYFIDNSHSVRVLMKPDKTLEKKENVEEKQVLESVCKKLSSSKKASLITQAKKLQDYQETPSAVDTLPLVTRADIAVQGKEFSLQQEHHGPLEIFYHDCFTNGILYTDLVFDLPYIPEQDLSYLRLFALLLPQMGCGGRDYKTHLDYLLEHTGGIGAFLDLCQQAENPQKMVPFLSIHAKALSRKSDKLFSCLFDIVQSVDFTDVARLKELLMQHYHGMENSIRQSPLRYAINLAASNLSIPSRISYAWHGLEYFWKLKEMVTSFEKDPHPLIEKLQELKAQCLGLEKARLIVNAQEQTYQKIKQEGFFNLSQMPQRSFVPWDARYSPSKETSQAREIPSPVAFTAMACSSLPYMHPEASSLSLAAQIMTNKVLHKRIREQGGAYGTGPANLVSSGCFYFYAYRDPYVKKTLKAFEEAAEEISQGNFTTKDLEEGLLGIIQDIDTPVAPGSRAMLSYSRLRCGYSPSNRQTYRKNLLSSKKEDVQKVAKNYLLSHLKKKTTVCFAGKELLEKENVLPIYPL